MCFTPHWKHAYHPSGKSPDPILLIGRDSPSFAGRRRPLSIHLKTLQVSVFDRELYMADHRKSDSYVSVDGILLEASDFDVTQWAAPGQTFDNGEAWKKLCRQGGAVKLLIPHDGWIP